MVLLPVLAVSTGFTRYVLAIRLRNLSSRLQYALKYSFLLFRAIWQSRILRMKLASEAVSVIACRIKVFVLVTILARFSF